MELFACRQISSATANSATQTCRMRSPKRSVTPTAGSEPGRGHRGSGYSKPADPGAASQEFRMLGQPSHDRVSGLITYAAVDQKRKQTARARAAVALDA